MQPNFCAISQVYLDVAIWPPWQKFARGRKFWAMRILIDETIPTQVETYLRARGIHIQKPLFDF
jgi:hypothetical protein